MMSNIITFPRSRSLIIVYANIIRKIAQIQNGFFDVVRFLEFSCHELLGTDVEIVDDNSNELAINEYAKYIPSENIIKIKQSVYDGAVDGNGKDRFTLAHELGHAILHRELALSRCDRKPKTYEDPEWQANEFAANVLCPMNEISNKDIFKIAETYGVSLEVAQNQINKKERLKI